MEVDPEMRFSSIKNVFLCILCICFGKKYTNYTGLLVVLLAVAAAVVCAEMFM